MSCERSNLRQPQRLAVVALGLAVAACANIGPGTVPHDRIDYATAIGDSWKAQTLLNIVKLRYADMPIFLEVARVIAGYQLQSAITKSFAAGNVTAGLVGPFTAAGTTTAAGTYTDRPTVIYSPLTGVDFLKRLMTPICHACGYAHISTVEHLCHRPGGLCGNPCRQRQAGGRQIIFARPDMSPLDYRDNTILSKPIRIWRERSQMEKTPVPKPLAILCIGALLMLSVMPDAFGWGAVTGPRGGAAYRGPMGGAAVRTPSGAAAVRGPYGGAAARGPYGGTAYRAPGYGGGAVYRGPVYGGTVYRPGVGAGVAVGAAAGVAVGAAAGAAAASTYPSCYYPPYYCYPPPYYQPPAW